MEFIQKYFKIIAIVAGVVVVALVVVLFLVNRSKNTNSNTNTTNDLISDSTTPYLNDGSISKDDKYLMLLGQEMAENYGTYKTGDPGPLLDLLNQSTESFAPKVQAMIDNIKDSTDIKTVVDPSSISLQKISDIKVSVSVKAAQTDNINKKIANVQYTVELRKTGQFWQVDDIH